jgi:hypothetical protein
VSGTRVLVAGASIAGPALAHWLHRRGAEVTVVERAPELRPGGQAVDARGVAKEVIGRMGLDAAVRAACTDTAGAHTVDADGQVLERMRSFVEANQEIGRLNARSRDVPGPDAEPSPDFASEWFTELVGRAINGIELPDYAGVPDSAAPAGSPITSSAKP